MNSPQVQRWAAFASDARGGNPAGVVLSAGGLDAAQMLHIAAEVGYAETAFVTGTTGTARRIRYFSPIAEVPFCGHATVATAAAIATVEGDGRLVFATPVGEVEITTRKDSTGVAVSFTSVEPDVAELPTQTLAKLLSMLGLRAEDLHPDYPAMLAFGGNWHPLIVVSDRSVFDEFRFDPASARHLMDAEDWLATIIVLWPESSARWHARNVFPVGAVVEDPATGAAAAATGGYLRATHPVNHPTRIVIEQGAHIGRPSELVVDIPQQGGIIVSGIAARID
jgi:PhzF family phenazine biosynthesis protein